MARIKLRPGHVQPIWAGHPWVFAQAIDRIEGGAAPGDEIDVVDARGQFLGRGFYSPKSAIVVRILSRIEGEELDGTFLGKRIEAAAKWRKELFALPDARTNGYRLLHSEGDGLGGLIADVYGDVVSVQLLTMGMKRREQEIFAEVARVTGARTVIEIGNESVEKLEGFKSATSVVRGPEISSFHFQENGFDFDIPVEIAQKTGYFFDQRDNRAMIEKLSAGKTVLDAFSYVGAFALAAARGGATRVVALDSSAPAITAGASIALHAKLNDKIEFTRDDAKTALPQMAAKHEEFDIVIVDPPKLVPTARHLDAGRKAYRRLNATAAKLVKKGGLLVSCSCSGAMRQGDFLRTIGSAARESGRDVTLLHLGSQGADHPVPASFPEGRYLKCAILRVS